MLPASSLTVANGVVYAHEAAGISALRADDGTLIWCSRSTYADYGRTFTPPIVTDGVVIVDKEYNGSDAPIARHRSDGSRAWQSQPAPHAAHDASGFAYPTVVDGIVYAGTSQDSIAAWRVADGRFLWQSPLLIPPAHEFPSRGQLPLVANSPAGGGRECRLLRR